MGNKILNRSNTRYLSKTTLIMVLIILLSEYSFAQSQWERITPNEIKNVETVEFDRNGNIFIGTWFDGVFQSSDKGLTWLRNNDADYPLNIIELAITSNGIIFCGTQTPLNYRSTDNGYTWERLPVGCDIWSFGIDSKDRIYFANGDCIPSIYRSPNYGDDWERIDKDQNFNSYVKDIEITKEDMILLASYGSPLFDHVYYMESKSDILSIMNINKSAYDIEVNSTGDIFLCGIGGNIYCSTDNGLTWDSLKVSSDYIFSLEIDESDVLYMGGEGNNVFVSTDYGTNWSNSIIEKDSTMMMVWELKSSGGQIFAATNMGLYRSNTIVSSIKNEQQPKNYSLQQNYPNPFNPATTIEYSLSSSVVVSRIASTRNLEGQQISPTTSGIRNNMVHVKLIVYDILGQEIATLVNEWQSPGNYRVKFNAEQLVSGVYYYELDIGNKYSMTRKMLLLR